MWQGLLLALVRLILTGLAEREVRRLISSRKRNHVMNIVTVPIPCYDPATRRGNYNSGRGGVSVDTVVVHWTVGRLLGADLTFSNPSSVHSAHRGIEDDAVHNYVGVGDTAFHAGIYAVNQRSLGYELSAQPGRDATPLTYETASQAIVADLRSLGKRVGDVTFRRHGDIVPTQCCGTVDVGRIRSRCLEIEAGGQPIVIIPASATVRVPVKVAGKVVAKNGLNVRSSPGVPKPPTPSNFLRTMSDGQGFWYVGAMTAEGRVWLELEDGNYCAAEFTDYKPSTNNA